MTVRPAALITGSSRGIGAAIAKALAAAGIPVALIARDESKLHVVAEEIRASGGTAEYRLADITDAFDVSRAVLELSDVMPTPFSLIVNAAGRIDREVPLWEADAEQWRAVIETNLIGSFNVSRAAIPGMLAIGGGRVVELASGAGAKDWDKASAYTSSKAGVMRLAGHLHEAGYAGGLRSFAVAPGVVKTDMTDSMDLHRGRTEFTPVAATCELVLAIYHGELDAWSGKYLRAGQDSPASLAARVAADGVPAEWVRRLTVESWGENDPNAAGSRPSER